jgi:WD40 repeat protein
VRIWDGDTLTVSQELRLHFDAISAIAWHPTKPILAACSISNSIRLYDLSSAKIIEQWRSIETPQRLLFSPTGKYLISESNDAAVGRIWQVE